MDYVWYASYGSNLSESRFHCYITGGTPEGSTKAERGCSDPAFPLKAAPISLPYEMYFSEYSARWNGGVAFIDIEKDTSTKTFGKKYLITSNQFKQIVQQENGDFEMNVNLELARKVHTYSYNDSWYGNILYLGEAEGFPIFTFTDNRNLADKQITSPSLPYLKNIYHGLLDLFKDDKNLIEYLYSKKGVSEAYSIADLERYFK